MGDRNGNNVAFWEEYLKEYPLMQENDKLQTIKDLSQAQGARHVPKLWKVRGKEHLWW